MSLYDRIRGGMDIFSRGKTVKVSDKTTRFNVTPDKIGMTKILQYSKEYDELWESTSKYTAVDSSIELPPKVIRSDEAVTVGYLGSCDSWVYEWIIKHHGNECFENQVVTFKYLYCNIHNLLRLDIVGNHSKSMFKRTLFGKMRLGLIRRLITTLINLVCYDLMGNDNLAAKITSKHGIGEVFPMVNNGSPRLPRIEESEESGGSVFEIGVDAEKILR